jgi:hypothetical protein
MAYYRLYFFDHDNRMTDAVCLYCNTDEKAIAAARAQGDSHKIEVWQERRKVGVFKDLGDLAPR